MRNLILLASVLGFSSACAPPPAPPAAPPPAAPTPQPLTTVSLDAAPMDVFGIIVEGHGPHLARMTLSSTDISCELGPRREDEQRLTLTMVRELGDESPWRLARFRADTPALSGENTFALRDAPRVELPTSLDDRVVAKAQFNVPFEVDDQTVRFELGGSLPARGCGSLASTDDPATHDGLTLTVRGERIPIAGAIYRRDPATRKHRLTLSTGAVTCDGRLEETEVGLEITLDRIGRSVDAIGLGGIRLGETLESTVGRGAIRSKLKGLGKTVQVALDGGTDVDGYPLVLSGKAEATYCR